MNGEPIRILIADDDDLFRRVVRSVLEDEGDIEVVAEASDGEEAIALTTEHAPQVVLMDIRMPRLGGIEAARVLNELHPSTKVLMITSSDDDEDLFEAIKAGASGYLLKLVEGTEIVAAVRHVLAGEAALSPAMAVKIMKQFAATAMNDDHPALRPQLTNPELKVLRDITQGLSSEQVADKHDITVGTVNAHVYNLLAKIHLRSRIEDVAQRMRKRTGDDEPA